MSWFQHALNNSAPTFAAQATAVLLNHNQYSGPITLGGSDADGDVLSYTASPGSAVPSGAPVAPAYFNVA